MKDLYGLLAEKQKQLTELQREVDALLLAVKLLGNDKPIAGEAQSQPQMAVAVLEAHGKPMHVSEIASQISKRFKRSIKKANLSVVLFRYAKRGRHFYKVPGRPNTYGLLKWQIGPSPRIEVDVAGSMRK